MRRGIAIAALLLAAAAPGGSERSPDGYAVRLRITPAADGGVQRVTLPAAALAALRTRDGHDLRVFDVRLRAVPIARASSGADRRRDELAVLPILESRDLRTGARVSVRLDDRGRPRVAEVAGGDGERTERVGVAALLDARGVVGSAERLEIVAEVPAGQPVRLTVEASPDLATWRPIGERTLYRAPGSGPLTAAIPLGGAALARDCLRIGWSGAVTVRRAVLVSGGASRPVVVPAIAPALADDHALAFVAPALPFATLRVVPVAADGAVAIRVLGRDLPEQPWAPLAAGIAAPGAPALPLAASARVIRIEADARGAGFSTVPALELGFAPRAVAFAAAVPGPYLLAAGRADASDAFLPLDEVAPASARAEAQVEPGAAPTITLAAPDESGGRKRQALLWAVLLAAVALLGTLTWWAMRRPSADPASKG